MKGAFTKEKGKLMKTGKVLHGRRANNLWKRPEDTKVKWDGRFAKVKGNIAWKGKMSQYHQKGHSHWKDGQKYEVEQTIRSEKRHKSKLKEHMCKGKGQHC